MMNDWPHRGSRRKLRIGARGDPFWSSGFAFAGRLVPIAEGLSALDRRFECRAQGLALFDQNLERRPRDLQHSGGRNRHHRHRTGIAAHHADFAELLAPPDAAEHEDARVGPALADLEDALPDDMLYRMI